VTRKIDTQHDACREGREGTCGLSAEQQQEIAAIWRL
jgi:hypothetical protein